MLLKAGAAEFFASLLKTVGNRGATPELVKTEELGKTVDQKAVRLNKIDAEAMAALRNGDLAGGVEKLLEVAKEYTKLTPDDCPAEESLALGVILARISVLVAKQSKDEVVLAYITAAQQYARKGGIARTDYPGWFQGRDDRNDSSCRQEVASMT